jgi:hypothetical protein
MKLVVRLMWAAVLGALFFWSWNFFFPAPQKVIENHLKKLARLASFSATDGNIKRLADTERLGSLLAEKIHVVLDAPGLRGETFDNREKKSAEAFLTVLAKIAGEPDLIIEPLKFTFQNTNDDWLITGIETVKSLR